MTYDELYDAIQTSSAGDGDRLLDICTHLLIEIRELDARLKRVEKDRNQ